MHSVLDDVDVDDSVVKKTLNILLISDGLFHEKVPLLMIEDVEVSLFDLILINDNYYFFRI